MFPFGKSPFKGMMENLPKGMASKDMNKYIQQMISSTMSHSFPDFMQGNEFFKQAQDMMKEQQDMGNEGHGQKLRKFDSNVINTLDECIVQLKIPNRDIVSSIKVYHTPYVCTIEGIDGEEPFKEEIQLPCSVRKKGTRAVYRSGVLEIRMPKHVNIPMSQIDVHDLD
ncbi:spore gernimation protein GerT [Priestia aryabhattai]|uniref:Hsp20/alpha crystallin family protein n=1 Tax=Priestia aryabhattai TaxID=412384 RepID=UPI00203CAC37|nr:spore gernimation protein GerT [Priestia aryabhattai]MCM3770728.1 spore gernimation protein GerT [Priestia aryabhattai]